MIPVIEGTAASKSTRITIGGRVILARSTWVALMALMGVVSALVGCMGSGGETSLDLLTIGEDRELEGRVVAVAATPMFVDGDGEILLQAAAYGRVLIRIPAREQLCQAQGLGVFSSLASGDSVRLTGRVTRPKELTVCVEETHFLEKVGGT
ncbi:hypothetical protein HUS23_03880 [Ectothiorhodospiraceae bacterium 2226]|nr:hypothetical protein HUS23_03880 [Ectothiorhodospiraceae bacterium 2226]